MALSADNVPITIACPKCGHKTQQTIGGIKANPQFTCPCGQVVHYRTDKLAGDLSQAEQMIRDKFKK